MTGASGSFDLVGGRVWTAQGTEAIDSGYVSVRDGLITAVGAGEPPVDAENAGILRVDAAGCTVIPGLTDAHVHLTTPSSHVAPVDNATYRALVSNPAKLLNGIRNAMRALASGFTTLRVMGHRDVGEPELRDFIDQGLIVGPRMLVAPWPISMTGGRGDLFWPATVQRDALDTADGVDDVRKMVRLQRKRGADFIKVTASGGVLSGGDRPHWPNYTEPELAALCEEAHDYDLKVAAHAHSSAGILRSVRAGVDSIEHGSFIDDEGIELMLERGTWLVPTLALIDWIASGRVSSVSEEGRAKALAARDIGQANVRKAVAAGVRLAMGTDTTGTICPFGQHARELELYVDALGLTPAQALMTATSNAAELLGIADQQGTIEPGKVADLLVVQGDPLRDITVLRSGGIRTIFRRGVDVTDPWPGVTAVFRDEPSIFRS